MTEPLRLSTVLDACLPGYAQTHRLNPRQWQVCHHILDCRTERLGETRMQCDSCGQPATFYHACRDRHCPRCQRSASQAWCERQSANTLDVTYYHVVFTLPETVNPLVELHPEVIYDQVLKSVWATLSRFGADAKRLNGQLGATLFLHTWGQTMVRHVHAHGLVPGGALTRQGAWNEARSTYLFPVRALSRYFRGHFVRALRQRYQHGELARVRDPKALRARLDALMEKDWVVYAKPCLQRPETVVAYLARYTHRVALSDSRLVDFKDQRVGLRYKDYRDERQKTMNLSAEELIRRYLLHVLPKGLMRIRHCGFLANRCRKTKLAQIRAILNDKTTEETTTDTHGDEPRGYPCAHCKKGRLRIVASHIAPSVAFTGTSPPRDSKPVR
jgi:hypothetical protein